MTDTQRTEAPEVVHLTVDGQPVEARPGELIIEAAARVGVVIPRFCYHPRMAPVGMCRMCLVEVSGPRGLSLQPACFFSVAEGQEIVTASPKARKAQEGVLEFLLVNHPLDCPVCDKGGECPLQDQTLSHGPGESRFVEEKRHFEKPIALGPLVNLDRERCIQCARCTRFASEIAGEALIDFAFRGERVEVATFPDRPFSSYFSGNTVQICPVGALTSTPYRFKSRPWDLEQAETTCTTCALGCRVVAQSSAGALVRYLGIDTEPVNQSWLCDKGRYAFEATRDEGRLTKPLVRRAGELVPVPWHEALAEFAAGVRQAAGVGPTAIGVIGGARLSNEDAYAWAKLVKGTWRADSVDAQLGDGLPAEVVLGLPRATIEEAVGARTVLLLAGDLREELPVLYLRLRDAAIRKGARLVECSPVGTALSEHAAVRVPYLPGEIARLAEALAGQGEHELTGVAPEAVEAARSALAPADGEVAGSGVVVVLGRSSLAESDEALAAAAIRLASALPGARFLPALRRGNVQGALDMGLAPGILPGRVGLGEGRDWFAAAWGAVPESRGRDTTGILSAAAAGELSMLVLLGADPLADFPDRGLAREALAAVPFLVALGTHADASNEAAHLVLPIAGTDERAGTTTSCEGRVSRLAQKVVPPGVAWPAWTVAAELAHRLGADLGFENLESVSAELASLVPAYRGAGMAQLARPGARDGLVVPIRETAVNIGMMPTALMFDPIATPGIASVEEQGAPLAVGAGIPLGGEAQEEPEAAPGRPPMLVLPAAAPAPTPAPRLDAYSLRLVLRRTLYDGGTAVSASPSLAALRPTQRVTVHPRELARLGVAEGERVRLRSPRGALDLEVAVDPGCHRNVVAVEANLAAPGSPDPGDLVEAGAGATDVHLETI